MTASKITAFILILVAAFPVRAGTGPDGPFLCIVEQATGFSFDKQSKSWNRTTFAAGEKYVLKRVENGTLDGVNQTIHGGPHAAWGVWKFGESLFGTEFCDADVNNSYLWCRGIESIFNVNLKSGRFLRTYAGAYVSDPSEFPDEHADTPVIEIGKCTAL
jgi:hypothetical protein